MDQKKDFRIEFVSGRMKWRAIWKREEQGSGLSKFYETGQI
jgi:hypothetical protein